MSYAESLLGYVKSFKLATLVGEPTAQANGNINLYSCQAITAFHVPV